MPKQKIKITIFILLYFLTNIAVVSAAIPNGYYYYIKNKKKAALKTALHTYCGPMFEFEYGGGPGFTWQGFYSTDRRADSTVVDMYSNTVRKFTGYSAINGMHIEHSFPKSWWGSHVNNAYKDLFHLYPADASANESKNNLPLGEVTGVPGFDNGVSKVGKNGFETAYIDRCFEPADEFKGDFARSYFYISTIYENLAPLMQSPMVITGSTYPFWNSWGLDLLLKWSRLDPVSEKERTRIEEVYNIQGNRNPFIDYPDLAEYIWGADTAKVYPFPEETEPFLLTPRRGVNIDFGFILQTDTRSQNIHIQGANISSAVQLSLTRNNPAISVSPTSIAAQDCTNGIDLTVTFTPKASGSVRDTLLISGGGMTENIRIPIKALATSNFITIEPNLITPVGGNLQWISEPAATDYKLNVYQGDTQAGDLIISAYVEGSSWNKALELYNGTGKTIDLSNYTLQRQTDGSGDFGSTINLTGTLPTNQTYVLVNNNFNIDAGLKAKAQRLDSLVNFNGNDAVALLRNGVIIDMVGPADAGPAFIWGMDMTLQRKPSVTHPLTVFNPAEWTTLPINAWSILGSHSMNFSSSSNYILQNVSTANITSYLMDGLNPQSTYTYSVEAIKPGGNVTAINTMQLHTSSLDAPIIMDPENIQADKFTANWEDTPYASGYLLDVIKLSGQSNTTEVEGFVNIGSSGTPLPTGWTGIASGNSTSASSFGIASPSLYFKNAGEWAQTKPYPQAVSSLTFMYRFATYVAGASLILDGYSNGNKVRIDSIPCKNNGKINPIYTFSKAQAFNSFRFTFNKMPGGNFALDDVSVTYGNQDTTYILKDHPVSTNRTDISALTSSTQYFYQVRATLGGSVSLPSELMEATTTLTNAVELARNSDIKMFASLNRIKITGLKGSELIQIYSLTGICMYQQKASSTIAEIPMKQTGIFIVRVQCTASQLTCKIIL